MSDNLICFCVMLTLLSLVMLAARVATQNPEDLFQGRVRKVTYEGHEYLYLIYNRGICHSPECKCLTKAETKGDNDEND